MDNYFTLATYVNSARTTWHTQADFLNMWPTHPNAYTSVARDIDMMEHEKILVLPPAPEKPITADLGHSIHSNQSAYDGKMWTPEKTKFMGEVAGIALYQDRIDPYSQPRFFSEAVIQNLNNIQPYEVDELLKQVEAQKKAFQGQSANLAVAEQLLKSIKKLDDAKKATQILVCACGHTEADHAPQHSNYIQKLCMLSGCSCQSFRPVASS
jgi:hypothetical protein